MKRRNYQKDTTHPHFFAVRLSDMELDFLNQKSEKLGITKAELFRRLLSEKPIINKIEIVANIEELKVLVSAYGKIASNLNQIAKYYNTGGEVSLAITDEIRQSISDLFALRKNVLNMASTFKSNNQNC